MRRGQEVMLNEAMNVVPRGLRASGEVVMLKEILDGGDRALVIAHADEERVVAAGRAADGRPAAAPATRC